MPIISIAVDGDAIYFATSRRAPPPDAGAPEGAVWACRLPDCKGGPVELASRQLDAVSVAVQKDFVYWVDRGSASLAGALRRVRR